MAEDWAADVKRFAPDADDGVIAGIVRYCGIALQKRDSSLVSMTDPVETKRVRENFLKRKLGLTDADAVLDAAIAEVGQIMKSANFKNRVTVYYLLVDKFGMHDLFRKTTATKAKASAKAKPAADAVLPAAAGLGAAGVIATASAAEPEAVGAPEPPPAPAPIPEPVAAAAPPPPAAPPPLSAEAAPQSAVARFADVPPPAAAVPAPVADDGKGGGMGWLWWLLGLVLIGLLIWWLFLRHPAPPPPVATTTPIEAAPAAPPADPGNSAMATTDLSAAPAEGSVTIPTGAGVTSELRDGKPVVKVYFDTAKTDVTPAFTATATALKDWLAAHPGTRLAVSGYNDKTGNAAANGELSKNRAKAVRDQLVAAGIADTAVALVKPSDTTDTAVDNAAARRVEVVVR